MLFLLGSAIVALFLTLAMARLVTRRYPSRSATWQAMLAASSFPLLSLLVFAGVTAATLFDSGDPTHAQAAGMVIFGFVFFLVYAVMLGVIIGVPTAIIAVNRFRAR